MSEFLNPQEITALTGYVMPSKQADWLKLKSTPHKLCADDATEKIWRLRTTKYGRLTTAPQ